MTKVVRLFDIRWDTDGEDPTELGLPKEAIAFVDDDWNPVDDAADFLSDQFGFCVFGCAFTVLTHPSLNETGFSLEDGGIIEYPDSEGTIRRLDQHGNLVEVGNRATTTIGNGNLCSSRTDNETTAKGDPRQPTLPQVRATSPSDSPGPSSTRIRADSKRPTGSSNESRRSADRCGRSGQGVWRRGCSTACCHNPLTF